MILIKTLNGIYRQFRNFSGEFACKRRRYLSTYDKSAYGNIVSESRMKEMLHNRQFVHVASATPSPGCMDLSVGSYNILAQYQLHNNAYLYTHCDQQVLDWPMRWSNIRADLERLNCDIFCLQEVQCDHYHSDIQPAMDTLGYHGFLSPKTGHKQDGCAMFIKRSRFDIDRSHFETLPFRREGIRVLSTDNVGQLGILVPRGSSSSSNSEDTHQLCVANTHLFFNPNRGEVKLAELCVLFAALDRVAQMDSVGPNDETPRYRPTILCGDLNSEPISELYRFLVQGQLKLDGQLACNISGQNETSFWGKKSDYVLSSEDLPPRIGISDKLVHTPSLVATAEAVSSSSDSPTTSSVSLSPEQNGIKDPTWKIGLDCGSGVLTHNFGWQSAYVYSTEQKPRMVTAFTNADTCAVDYIFLSRGLVNYPISSSGSSCRAAAAPDTLQLLSYLELFTSDEFFSFGGIPNLFHGSDHIPLVAQMRWQLNQTSDKSPEQGSS